MAHKTYPRSIQLGDLIEVIADAIPNEPALITNDVKFTYAELDERITRLANHLLSIGIKRGEHVGVHAQNTHEWVEAFYACAKISAVAINVNYRYVAAELRYLYDNADCVAVIADPEYLSAINDVRDALPNLRNVIVLGADYEAALAAASPDRDFPGRTADDMYVLYTGGTTGMPKGVMWRHEDVILGAMNSARANRPIDRIEQLGEEAAVSAFRARLMSIGPMMHGGGQWIMGNAITAGGCFVLYTKKRFDAHDVWQLVADGVVTSVSTIGDAMARPLAEHLVSEPRPTYDLSMLFAIGNGGAPLSTGVREQIREALPNVAILDSFGASETGAAGARADDGSAMSSPKFAMSDDTTVLAEDGRQCGVGESASWRVAETFRWATSKIQSRPPKLSVPLMASAGSSQVTLLRLKTMVRLHCWVVVRSALTRVEKRFTLKKLNQHSSNIPQCLTPLSSVRQTSVGASRSRH